MGGASREPGRDDVSKAFHDIRNSLGAISMNLEVAVDPAAPPEEARAATADALASCRDLEERLARLRALVQPERGGSR